MYFFKNWDEIYQDKPLRLYGACLAFIHVISAYLLIHLKYYYFLSTDAIVPICFPGLEGCERFRFLNFTETQYLLYVYGAVAVICVLTFLRDRFKKIGPPLLLGLCLFKMVLQLADYRVSSNFHFLAQVVTFAYLLLPNRKFTLAILIPAIYFCAGLLKFNHDWLSGQALISPSIIQGSLLSVLLVYVIILEVFIVWFVLSKNKKIRYFILLQLICFHIYSWHIVGYPYPVFMFCILPYFLLITPEIEFKRDYYKIFTIIGIFLFFQMLPYALVKDPALDGRSRLYSLNMLDATTICESTFEFHPEKGENIKFQMPFKIKRVRIACDPHLRSEVARIYCHKTIKPGTLFVKHVSRRSTDKEMQTILDYSLNCPGKSNGH